MKADPISSIPQVGAKPEEWINFDKVLVSNFGRKVASTIWLKAWKLRGSAAANTLDLRKYMQGQGIKLSETAWDSLVDVGGSAIDHITSIFQMGKYASYAVGGIILLGLTVAIVHAARHPDQVVTVAKTLA